MTKKRPNTGYRRTKKSVKGRPKKEAAERKTFQGTFKFDAAMDQALNDEQKRRGKAGQKDSRATIMRSLIIKGLRDLGHELDQEND